MDFFNFLLRFRGYSAWSKIFVSISLVKVFNKLCSALNFTFASEREDEITVRELVYYWFLFLFSLVVMSLVVFVNEELDTSLSELLLEILFVAWLVFYVPDVCLYGVNVLNNKVLFTTGSLFSVFLPLIEHLSQFAKIVTLGVRLNTNYVSGHLLLLFFILLLDLFALSHYVGYFLLISVFTILIYLLELFIIVLQLYVVLVLLTLYIKEASF